MNKNNAYQEALGVLSYSQEQKDLIAANAAAEAMKSRRCHRIHFPFSKIASVAACLLCVLTLTAEAAGIPTPVSRWLGPIFGNRVAQTEVIDSIGIPLDAYDTDNGITITADAIIGDKYNTAFLFTIRPEDGTSILPEGITLDQLNFRSWGTVSKQEGNYHGSSRFLDLDPNDPAIQFLMQLTYDLPVTKEPSVLRLHDLRYWDEESQSSKILCEGKWRFRMSVDYEDTSVVLGNEGAFQQAGMMFTITEVRISPIAVRVSYEVDSEVIWSGSPDGRLPAENRAQMERYIVNVGIHLVKKDGSVIDMGNYVGGPINKENGKTICTRGAVLPEIIPLEELDKIIVGDVEYPLT